MARRARADDERSMDSLLDALTNVVGVLLLILIISSLGLSQAVKVVVENLPQVTKEDLKELKVRAENTRENLKKLEQAAVDPEKKSRMKKHLSNSCSRSKKLKKITWIWLRKTPIWRSCRKR